MTSALGAKRNGRGREGEKADRQPVESKRKARWSRRCQSNVSRVDGGETNLAWDFAKSCVLLHDFLVSYRQADQESSNVEGRRMGRIRFGLEFGEREWSGGAKRSA